MNILLLNYDSNPQFIGGIKRVIITLAKEWIKMGHQVCMLSQCMSDYMPSEVEGISQYFLPFARDMGRDENILIFRKTLEDNHIDIVLNAYVDEDDLSQLAYTCVSQYPEVRLISAYHFAPTHDVDVVRYSFFPKYYPGCRWKKWLLDITLYCKFHLLTKRRLYQKIKDRLETAAQNSDALVLLSEQYRRTVASMIGGSHRVLSINNPIEFVNRRDEIDLSAKEKIVLWCGRVGYGMKRIDRMMSIWKRVAYRYPDWRCCVLGSGDIKTFADMAKKHNIPRIEFVGFCNPFEWYNRASILCMTSSTEGWPMVLLETMSHGCLPIIYHSFDGAACIIEDNVDGRLVSPFDENEFVEKLAELMEDSEKRKTMSVASISSVVRFYAPKIAEEWINLFKLIQN